MKRWPPDTATTEARLSSKGGDATGIHFAPLSAEAYSQSESVPAKSVVPRTPRVVARLIGGNSGVMADQLLPRSEVRNTFPSVETKRYPSFTAKEATPASRKLDWTLGNPESAASQVMPWSVEMETRPVLVPANKSFPWRANRL